MERAIDESLDGTGGGYGRYPGVTLREIAVLLDKCRLDPSMRGVSGALRIAHEQLDARGGLGTYPWMTASAFGAAALLFGVSFLVPAAFAEKARQGAGAVAVVGLLFLGISHNLRIARKKALYQEEQIRNMALDTLAAIVQTEGFVKKPLDNLQRLTIQRLLKKTKRNEPLVASLLD